MHNKVIITPAINNSVSKARRPKVTVIIPAYNSAATIGPCIESLLAQDYPSECYRIVVVDNNSSDDTASIAQLYPGVTLAFEREIQTSYAARNRGIALADTEFIAFLDSDCVADKDWLQNLIWPFNDPIVGVVGGTRTSQTPDADVSLVESFLAQVLVHDEKLYSPHPAEPKGFPTANVAYRATALEKVGIFDAAMPGGGDVDLAWRVQAYGGYVGTYVPEALVLHKHRSTLVGLFRQSQRYGFSEAVLTTLYRGEAFHRRTPAFQLCLMARQVRALVTYGLSFGVRLFRWWRWRSDRMYLAWPVLWFVYESGCIFGKVHGLIRTRFFRRNPYPTNDQEVKRTTSLPVVAPRRTQLPENVPPAG